MPYIDHLLNVDQFRQTYSLRNDNSFDDFVIESDEEELDPMVQDFIEAMEQIDPNDPAFREIVATIMVYLRDSRSN
jgi:uncharacterized protein (UPF0305 family)